MLAKGILGSHWLLLLDKCLNIVMLWVALRIKYFYRLSLIQEQTEHTSFMYSIRVNER